MRVPMLQRRAPLNIVEFLCDPPQTAPTWTLHRAR